MPTREELHALVDTLPEPAMEVVHGLLSRLQVWSPPPPPRNVASGVQVRAADGKPVLSRFERWEGDTFIQETMRNHRRHELKVVEHIHAEGKRLIYKHEITGPADRQ